MLDVNSKLEKFASGYKQTPSREEKLELERLASEIVQDIKAGQLPTPQGLAAFHKFEIVADDPKRYSNQRDALGIIYALSEVVGNNPKLINDYNLVLHAAYLQETELVRRLIDVEGVEINKPAQGPGIRGESPLTVAGAMIDNLNSRRVFDLIADRLPKDRKTDQGNWVSWAFSNYNLEELLNVNERLEAFSDVFEIQPEMALKAATPLLGGNRGDPKEILAIQEYFERVLENMSDIKDHETFFRVNLGGLLAVTFSEQDSEIQLHRKELIAKLALLSDVKISSELADSNEFAKKLFKIQDAMLAMSEQDKNALREMIKHPSEHQFGNLVDIVFNEERLADFCKRLSEDKALYTLFLSRANAIPCLKPLVEVVEGEVQAKGTTFLRKMTAAFITPKITNETEARLNDVLGFGEIAIKEFEHISLKEDFQMVLEACGKYINVSDFVIPTLNSDKIAIMKSALTEVYDKWYSQSMDALIGDKNNKSNSQDDVTQGFTKKYVDLKQKLGDANLETIVEMAENLERTIGSNVKRERDRMRGSDAMSISSDSNISMSTDKLSSSSGSRRNSPRGRGE